MGVGGVVAPKWCRTASSWRFWKKKVIDSAMRMTTRIRRIIGGHFRREERVGRGRLRLTPGEGPAMARPGRGGGKRRGLRRATVEFYAALRGGEGGLRGFGRARGSPRRGVKVLVAAP